MLVLMMVTFRIRLADGTTGSVRRFAMHVEVPYSNAPHVGDAVELPVVGSPFGEGVGARRVHDVIWNLDGSIMIDVAIDGVVNDPNPQVEVITSAGYVEIPEALPAADPPASS
jgi:hypothetical protein